MKINRTIPLHFIFNLENMDLNFKKRNILKGVTAIKQPSPSYITCKHLHTCALSIKIYYAVDSNPLPKKKSLRDRYAPPLPIPDLLIVSKNENVFGHYQQEIFFLLYTFFFHLYFTISKRDSQWRGVVRVEECVDAVTHPG